MRSRIAIFALAFVLLCSVTAVAGEFEQGLELYQQGGFVAAREIFLPLAMKGDAKAQYALGLMYETGKGVEPGKVEAWRWYGLAADQGHAKATRQRDALARSMSPDELSQAQALLDKTYAAQLAGRPAPGLQVADEETRTPPVAEAPVMDTPSMDDATVMDTPINNTPIADSKDAAGAIVGGKSTTKTPSQSSISPSQDMQEPEAPTKPAGKLFGSVLSGSGTGAGSDALTGLEAVYGQRYVFHFPEGYERLEEGSEVEEAWGYAQGPQLANINLVEAALGGDPGEDMSFDTCREIVLGGLADMNEHFQAYGVRMHVVEEPQLEKTNGVQRCSYTGSYELDGSVFLVAQDVHYKRGVDWLFIVTSTWDSQRGSAEAERLKSAMGTFQIK